LDGLAACFFVLQGKINHIPQIIKAHWDFEKMKLKLKVGEDNKNLAELKGVLQSGLVYSYFIKGKKTWDKLGL
jgi:hypothetical protein